jgi:toxin CcdB
VARFDVFRTAGLEYLLDCQADALSHFKTRFVVPLLAPKGAVAATRLQPIFEIEGKKMVMVTQLASAVPLSEIGRKVASLADEQTTILNALDMLISGY